MRNGYDGYDPDGPGLDNGNFLGLPLVDDPAVRFLAVPYDATVSYGGGTAGGPANVLAASRQLDVCVPGSAAPWEFGFAWEEVRGASLERADELRAAGARAVAAAEDGGEPDPGDVAALDGAGEEIAGAVAAAVGGALDRGELPIVVGGEHAVALGAYRACASRGGFGVLQLDAHMDLRPAYEGLRHSHASVMHNALRESGLTQLTQVAVRDYAPVERDRARREGERVRVYLDDDLQRDLQEGRPFGELAREIVAGLPARLWISLDVDALEPALCAHTGTPVPGGLRFAQADRLLAEAVASGREILGLDLVEVAGPPHEFEGAVAARLAYRFAARAVSRRRARGRSR